VGGDYYDFLGMGPGRSGFVLADVSGKGVHAALLMANLQAHLRSRSGDTREDPVRLLEQVNAMLWKSTAAQHYATLFFGIYEGRTRRLAYVNCGHNPPVCLRRDGAVERLPATATVIGLFERWDGAVAEIQLFPGDLLAAFSDGIPEAARGEEEYGEGRLVDALRSHATLPTREIVSAVLAGVQQFSAGVPGDDLTLLVMRGRA
jgi:serine phosphatase RsbU (regulator of sigma subunit)